MLGDNEKEIIGKISDLFKEYSLSNIEVLSTIIPLMFSALHIVYEQDKRTGLCYIMSIRDMLDSFVYERASTICIKEHDKEDCLH